MTEYGSKITEESRVNIDLLEWEDYIVYYQNKPFNGIAYELRPDNSLWSEITYKMGLENGLSREWYDNGLLQSESNSKLGIYDGVSKEWYSNGKLKSEKFFELGYCITVKEWDEKGYLINESQIDKNSNNYKMLLSSRKHEPQRVIKILEKFST